MKNLPKLSSATKSLNSSTDFTTWSVEQIQRTVFALKSKADAFNCTLRITSSEIKLTNEIGDSFCANLGDDWSIESVEFNMSGATIRGDLSELDEITERAFTKLSALNELKQAWRDVSQWLELLAYAKANNLNSAKRRKLNSSLDYDYSGEELEDGYFEGSIAGFCSGLSQKYANARSGQFSNDIAAYVSTAADIIGATQHNDNFEVEISASDEDEFEDTVAEVVEFLKTMS